MRVRITVFIVLLLLITTSLSSGMVYADDTLPQIRVYPPPSRDFPLKIYVYQTDYDELNNREFKCPAHSRLVELFYMVQRDLYNSILRFVEEYPEYRKLVLLSFMNTSDPNQADITFRVVISASNSSYVLHGEGMPYQIYIECDEINETNIHGARNVIFHEFMHSLGIGHPVNVYLTSRGEGELMAGNDPTIDMYPTTLDLYALYKVFFDNIREEEVVSLPSSIEYKVVIPYRVEIEKLRQETDKLRNHLKDANMVIDHYMDRVKRLEDDVRDLKIENRELMEKWRGCEETVKDLVRYTDKLEEENRAIKAQYDKLLNASLTLYEEYNKTRDRLINLTNRYNELVERYNELLEAYDEAFEGRRTCALMLAVVAVILSSLYFWQYWNYTRLERELERLRG